MIARSRMEPYTERRKKRAHNINVGDKVRGNYHSTIFRGTEGIVSAVFTNKKGEQYVKFTNQSQEITLYAYKLDVIGPAVQINNEHAWNHYMQGDESWMN